MKTTEYQYQRLLEQATALYNSEKEISGIFDALRMNIDEPSLREQICREAAENRDHCTRLEGLLNILERDPLKNCDTESTWLSFVRQFSLTLKRIIAKHAEVGYKAAILAALALGQNEIADFLKCSLSTGNTILIRDNLVRQRSAI